MEILERTREVRAMRGAVAALRAGGRVLRLYLQLLQVLLAWIPCIVAGFESTKLRGTHPTSN